MNEATATKIYPAAEERINVASHALGLGLSVIGLAFLIGRAGSYDSTLFMTSFVIFGCSLVTLYAASTCYHAATDPRLRGRLRIVDHSSIYILIAGTYTPFALITLNGTTGWVIFGTVWGMALTGIVLKLYYTGRYRMLSTLMYLFMGWLIIFALRPLIENLHSDGLRWLVAGGISYTVGAILYSIKSIPFGHAIFHVFVLLGSASHFVAVLLYVLPPG